MLDASSIQTTPNSNFNERLVEIYEDMKHIISEYKPDEAAIETLYFNKNIKTAIKVAEARGVVLLALERANIKISEYTPLQVKQSVVGYGRAEKKQVQQMIKSILNLKVVPKLDDTTDSIAMAICHAHSRNSALNKYIKTDKR